MALTGFRSNLIHVLRFSIIVMVYLYLKTLFYPRLHALFCRNLIHLFTLSFYTDIYCTSCECFGGKAAFSLSLMCMFGFLHGLFPLILYLF